MVSHGQGEHLDGEPLNGDGQSSSSSEATAAGHPQHDLDDNESVFKAGKESFRSNTINKSNSPKQHQPNEQKWNFKPAIMGIALVALGICAASHSATKPRRHTVHESQDLRSKVQQSYNKNVANAHSRGRKRSKASQQNVRKEEEQDDSEEENDQDESGDEEEDSEEDDDEENEDEEEDDDFFDENDDFFGEDLADDYIQENTIDDFYAFVEGPEQPHLFPLTEREIVGYFIASAALTLGASGGIGGGGIVVPVYLLVMGLAPKVAIPIGAVTVLGGTTSSTIVNWHRRHPLADRPIIDWDFVLVMQPVVLIGVILGTFLHQLLSEQILIFLLVVMLSVTAHSTLSKAMRMFEAEKRYIRHLKAAQAEPPGGSPSRTFTWGDGELHTLKPTMHSPTVDEEEKERILIENPDFVTLRSDLIEEEKITPSSKIIVVASVVSVLIVLNIMVGGDGVESPWGIVCGSPAFWTIHAVMICFLVAAAWAAQTYLIARHEIKNIVRFDYVHGDIRWNRRAGWLYPVVFCLAGLLAGVFGIGGGIIIVPLLLTIGTHPAVASATSSAMVFITSLVSSSVYFVFGLILRDFALVGFIIAFFSSLVGQMLMGRLRQARSASGRSFERNSYIAFVIGGVVLLSALLVTIQYIFSIVEGPRDDYGSLCDGLNFS